MKLEPIFEEATTTQEVEHIAIFDFDSTLVFSPDNTEESRQIYKQKTGQDYPHKGWFGRPESLDTTVFDIPIIPSTVNAYKKYVTQPNTLTVMLTGRIPKLSSQVESILSTNNLKFDEYLYNMGGATLDAKLSSLSMLLKKYPNTKTVTMFEDRDEHVIKFREFGQQMIDAGRLDSFIVNHVVGHGGNR